MSIPQLPSSLLTIHSSDRNSGGTSASGVINLGVYSIYNVEKIKLKQAYVYNTIYNIRTGINDTLTFKLAAATQYVATIPAGNYDTTTLGNALITALTAANNIGWGYTYSTSTGKYTIATPAIQWSFLFATVPTALADILGFSNTDTPLSLSAISDQIVSLGGPQCLFFTFNELSVKTRTTNPAENKYWTFVVPLSQSFGNLNLFNEETDFEQKLEFDSPRTINTLTYSLFTDGGEPAALNGSEWTLIVEVIFKKNVFSKHIC